LQAKLKEKKSVKQEVKGKDDSLDDFVVPETQFEYSDADRDEEEDGEGDADEEEVEELKKAKPAKAAIDLRSDDDYEEPASTKAGRTVANEVTRNTSIRAIRKKTKAKAPAKKKSKATKKKSSKKEDEADVLKRKKAKKASPAKDEEEDEPSAA
jgi:hypothetical protein